MHDRQRAPFRVRVEGFDLGTARHERLEQRVAAAPNLREQVRQDVGRVFAAKLHPQIDERQQDARPFGRKRQLAQQSEHLLCLDERRLVLDDDDRLIARGDRVAGEDLEIALGVDDDEPPPAAFHQHALQVEGILELSLELADARAGRHVVDAVLAQADRSVEVAGPQRRSHARSGDGSLEREHAIDHVLVVEPDEQDWQILAQSPDVDGQVGRERRLADAALVARHRQDPEGPSDPLRPGHVEPSLFDRSHRVRTGSRQRPVPPHCLS